MLQGFQSKIAEVVTADGRNFKLCRAIYYIAADGTIYVLPIGASTDGASVPAAFWSALPPFGDYWLAAFLHDCAYQNTLQYADSSACNLPKDKCDQLLKEAMESLGVDSARVETIYEGVSLGGWKAFRDDRQ
jgi:hypothetical protein